jgi:hypothetical protein
MPALLVPGLPQGRSRRRRRPHAVRRVSLRGHLVWHHVGGCGGSGGSTAVLHGTSLYAHGFRPLDTPIVLAKSSGDQVGTFPSGTAPAFDGTTGTVYSVSVKSHAKICSATAGSAIVGPDEQNSDVLIGMAIGGGLLVVPAATC